MAHARRFRWQDIADRLAACLMDLRHRADAGAYEEFFKEWQRIRTMQAAVDYG